MPATRRGDSGQVAQGPADRRSHENDLKVEHGKVVAFRTKACAVVQVRGIGWAETVSPATTSPLPPSAGHTAHAVHRRCRQVIVRGVGINGWHGGGIGMVMGAGCHRQQVLRVSTVGDLAAVRLEAARTRLPWSMSGLDKSRNSFRVHPAKNLTK